MSSKNYITPAGADKLKAEYAELFHNERPKLVETIAWAAGNGDRSENADYIYGKRRLREIDRRLRFLRERLEAAEIVDPQLIKSQAVVFGATVTVEDENGTTHTYQIVGEDEIDTKTKKISWKSPIAKALLGKKINDEALVKKPQGEEILLITEIRYI